GGAVASSTWHWSAKSTRDASPTSGGTRGPQRPKSSRTRASRCASRGGGGSGTHRLSWKGPRLPARTSATQAAIASARCRSSPAAPMPPALATAIDSAGGQAPAMGASRIGTSIPKRLQNSAARAKGAGMAGICQTPPFGASLRVTTRGPSPQSPCMKTSAIRLVVVVGSSLLLGCSSGSPGKPSGGTGGEEPGDTGGSGGAVSTGGSGTGGKATGGSGGQDTTGGSGGATGGAGGSSGGAGGSGDGGGGGSGGSEPGDGGAPPGDAGPQTGMPTYFPGMHPACPNCKNLFDGKTLTG